MISDWLKPSTCIMLKDIRAILWDFDGVLIDSNTVRENGFKKVLEDYPINEVEQLLSFHRLNGGLSRYVKFKHFFEKIRGEELTDDELFVWANHFSKIMKDLLVNSDLLINETNDFIRKRHKEFEMHIVSGSDQSELRFLCERLGLSSHFITINGSPTPKDQLVKHLLDKFGYNPIDCLLIGDSINDCEAAMKNMVKFMAYNNPDIEKYSNFSFELKI